MDIMGRTSLSVSLALLYHDFDELQQKNFAGTRTGEEKTRHK